MLLLETSAKENTNVDDAFLFLATELKVFITSNLTFMFHCIKSLKKSLVSKKKYFFKFFNISFQNFFFSVVLLLYFTLCVINSNKFRQTQINLGSYILHIVSYYVAITWMLFVKPVNCVMYMTHNIFWIPHISLNSFSRHATATVRPALSSPVDCDVNL